MKFTGKERDAQNPGAPEVRLRSAQDYFRERDFRTIASHFSDKRYTSAVLQDKILHWIVHLMGHPNIFDLIGDSEGCDQDVAKFYGPLNHFSLLHTFSGVVGHPTEMVGFGSASQSDPPEGQFGFAYLQFP